MTKEQWTKNDEACFQEMAKRRERIFAERVKSVTALGNLFSSSRNEVSPEYMTNWLINHADAIRDALAPYDSGIRAVEIGEKQ